MLRFLASIGADITPFQRGLSQVGNEWDKHIAKQQKKLSSAFGKSFGIGAIAGGALSVGRGLLENRQDQIAATRGGMSVGDWKAIQSAAEETGHSVEEITKNFSKLPDYVKEIVEAKKKGSKNPFGQAGEIINAEAGGNINDAIGGVKKFWEGTKTAFGALGVGISMLAQGAIGGLKATLGNDSEKAMGEAYLQGLFERAFGVPQGELLSRQLEERLAAAKKRRAERYDSVKSDSVRSERKYANDEVFDSLNRIGIFGQGQHMTSAQASERIARATEETARNTRGNGTPY